jgi:hypothetical protein
MTVDDRFGWLRRYWQGLLIAAAVSYGQLQDTDFTDVRAAQGHPFVWMLPDEPTGMSPLEIVDGQILTIPFELSTTERIWN